MQSEPHPLTFEELKSKALELGWDDAGITTPEVPQEDIDAYLEWLSEGHHGNLAYMENQFRCDPQHLLPDAKRALLFISHYKQPKQPFRPDAGLVASYARGRDYHHLHRSRLKKFIAWLEQRTGQQQIARGFSDSAPLMEKALAVKAGLGWFGKNTLLIHKKFGTFTLLSGLLTTLEIPLPEKILSMRQPRCGSCTRCLDACPTQALITPYRLDAVKCLSYHLIESKTELPENIIEKNPGYAFGCDICQDVCPHNQRKADTTLLDFAPESGIGPYLTSELLEKIESDPTRLFGTPLQRRGAQGLRHTMQNFINSKG